MQTTLNDIYKEFIRLKLAPPVETSFQMKERLNNNKLAMEKFIDMELSAIINVSDVNEYSIVSESFYIDHPDSVPYRGHVHSINFEFHLSHKNIIKEKILKLSSGDCIKIQGKIFSIIAYAEGIIGNKDPKFHYIDGKYFPFIEIRMQLNSIEKSNPFEYSIYDLLDKKTVELINKLKLKEEEKSKLTSKIYSLKADFKYKSSELKSQSEAYPELGQFTFWGITSFIVGLFMLITNHGGGFRYLLQGLIGLILFLGGLLFGWFAFPYFGEKIKNSSLSNDIDKISREISKAEEDDNAEIQEIEAEIQRLKKQLIARGF